MLRLAALEGSCLLLHGEQTMESQGVNRSIWRLMQKSRREVMVDQGGGSGGGEG